MYAGIRGNDGRRARETVSTVRAAFQRFPIIPGIISTVSLAPRNGTGVWVRRERHRCARVSTAIMDDYSLKLPAINGR